MLTKEKAKKRIADLGYTVLYSTKQHFATYDIMNAFPSIITVISLVVSIILLGYPEYERRWIATILLAFSVLSLYIEKGAQAKELYNQTAKSLNKIYKELKSLYLEIDDNNVQECMKEVKKLDKELEDICYSNHIPFLTNWLAHYNMFWVSRENSRWFVDELRLSFWKDKIPETMKMIIYICLALLIILILYAINSCFNIVHF